MVNPFKFGLEVSGAQFYDRIETAEKLHRRLAGGSGNVVMYAPRRYGKTSLVKKVLAQFRSEGVPTVYFDLNKVESLEKFCEEYASAVCSIAGRLPGFIETVQNYLSHLHPTFSFGGDFPISVRFDYGEKMTAQSLSSVLDLAEKVSAGREGGRLIIAFDEFQEVDRLSSDLPLEGIFRSCIQAHEHVRYVFFGSKTHLLMRMFGDRSQPFYKSASIVKLEKPSRDESIAFIKERFASCPIIVDDAVAERIVDTSENIPHYLQQLASIAYERVQMAGRDYLMSEDVEQAEDELIAENADYYQERLSGLSTSQRVLVSALAREPTMVFREDYRRRHALGGSSTVNTALRIVRDLGIVETDEKSYFVGDPFFAKFICRASASI